MFYLGEIWLKKSLFIYNSGELVRKDNSIRFYTEDGEKRDLPIENVGEINVMTQMNFNNSLLNILSKYGISLHFYNYYNFYIGSFYPKDSVVSGEVLVKQVESYLDYEKRLKLAKKIIDGASYNIYRNIRYYNSRGKDLEEFLEIISSYRNNIYSVDSIEALMGVEGNIRKVYYRAWNTIINREIDFEKRVKNPPDNMINTLISFTNSMVYTRVLGEIYKTQLNPTISFLHEPGSRRFSLSLDISEIFKPLICDRLIFSLLNKNQISENSFEKELNYLQLKKEASMLIAKEIDERMKKRIKHRELKREVSYQYLIRLECYKVVKHLIGEKEYEPFKIWWWLNVCDFSLWHIWRG